eukprot:5104898-Pleurochrysis_carterae.AAC.2
MARMHSFPICTRATCVLADRSSLLSSNYGPPYPPRAWPRTPPDCAPGPAPRPRPIPDRT